MREFLPDTTKHEPTPDPRRPGARVSSEGTEEQGGLARLNVNRRAHDQTRSGAQRKR